MFRLTAALTLAAFLAFTYLSVSKQDTEPEDDKIEIPHKDENTISRRDFMRTKLMYCQNIFEGLTTGNVDLIKEGIREVSAITKAEKWVSIDDDRYRKLTVDFETAIDRLSAAAKTGNVEATALRYYQMSTSCIDCHQHIRKVEYEY